MPGTGSAWIKENNPRALKEFDLVGKRNVDHQLYESYVRDFAVHQSSEQLGLNGSKKLHETPVAGPG